MLNAIAIDDEPIALEVIKSLSRKVPFLELKECFTNALEATKYIRENDINLMFLDINMPDISGIDYLQTLSSPPMVIFTTAYSEYAVEGFELSAIDYLLKPFSFNRFLKALDKANEQMMLRKGIATSTEQPGYLFLKSGYEKIRVNYEDILYVEGAGNYMKFVMTDEKIISSRLTIKEVEELLPEPTFVRVHRSYVVSKKKITKLEKWSVWIGKKEIPIGAGYSSGKVDLL